MTDEMKRAEVTEWHRIRASNAIEPVNAAVVGWLARVIADAEARGEQRGRAKSLEEAAVLADRLILEPDDGDVARESASETAHELAIRIRALAAKETT